MSKITGPHRLRFSNAKEKLELFKKLDDVGLYFDAIHNIARCKTCGCPAQICTCVKPNLREDAQ